MGDHTPVKIDKEQQKRAETMWHNFTDLMTKSIIATVFILVAMGAIFVDW